MKKTILTFASISLLYMSAEAQFDFDKLKKDVENSIKTTTGGSSNGSSGSSNSPLENVLGGLGNILGGGSASGMTNAKASEGLKSALKAGTDFASGKLGSVDGFLADAAVKILFPPEAQKVESTLRKLGFNKQCDNVIRTINRAAEGAVVEAKPIFAAAITQMTLQDAISILTGGEGAATNYLKKTSGQALINKFSPIINNHLSKTGATKHWSTVMKAYNKVPFVEKVNPDLTQYVTQKAVDGIFLKVAEEEKNIRTNPTARVSSILQEVFGWADQQKK